MNDNWEYKAIDYQETGFLAGTIKVEPLEKQLNDLGRQGWELVSTTPNRYFRGSKGLVLILKRRR